MATAPLKEIALIRIYVIHFCMTQKEPGWELFHTFLEVARDGSLSGAARKLALTQPTVGRHIDALEAALGLSLFSRSPHPTGCRRAPPPERCGTAPSRALSESYKNV